MTSTHEGVILLVKLQVSAREKYDLKVSLLHGCFSLFLNSINGTKLPKASHILTPVSHSHIFLPNSLQPLSPSLTSFL